VSVGAHKAILTRKMNIAVTLAARNFDREFLRRFFREELVQMQHATLIDEWLEETTQ